MRFSYKPGELDVFGGSTGKSLGNCRGWKPPGATCENGFATDDVYFLEVCIFSFVCKNNVDLFKLSPRDFYVCEFDGDAFDELQTILLEKPTN